MLSANFPDQLAIVAFLALLTWAAVGDYYRYLIPNGLCAAVAALFFAHALAGGPAVDWVGGLLTGGAVFLVGFGMFALRLIGGGDVKLLSAVALWAGPAWIVDVLLITALAGGVLSLSMMTMLHLYRPGPVDSSLADSGPMNGVPGDGATSLSRLRKQTVPYGIAIAAGGFYLGARLLAG